MFAMLSQSFAMKRSFHLIIALALAAATCCAQPPPLTQAGSQSLLDRAIELAANKEKHAEAALAEFTTAVEQDPDHIPTHDALRKFRNDLMYQAHQQPRIDGILKAIDEQYAGWEKRYPDSVGINYA